MQRPLKTWRCCGAPYASEEGEQANRSATAASYLPHSLQHGLASLPATGCMWRSGMLFLPPSTVVRIHARHTVDAAQPCLRLSTLLLHWPITYKVSSPTKAGYTLRKTKLPQAVTDCAITNIISTQGSRFAPANSALFVITSSSCDQRRA